MPEFLRRVFASDGFLPHGHCFLWKPGLVWLHVSADVLIGLSYVAIRSRSPISCTARAATSRSTIGP